MSGEVRSPAGHDASWAPDQYPARAPELQVRPPTVVDPKSRSVTPGQPGSPRRLRRATTTMSTTATAARKARIPARTGSLARITNADAPSAQTTKPKAASTRGRVRALRAGAAPPKPAVGSW